MIHWPRCKPAHITNKFLVVVADLLIALLASIAASEMRALLTYHPFQA